MVKKCVTLLSQIGFQCNDGDPLTMSESDLAACARTSEDGNDQGAKMTQSIQALHSADSPLIAMITIAIAPRSALSELACFTGSLALTHRGPGRSAPEGT